MFILFTQYLFVSFKISGPKLKPILFVNVIERREIKINIKIMYEYPSEIVPKITVSSDIDPN